MRLLLTLLILTLMSPVNSFSQKPFKDATQDEFKNFEKESETQFYREMHGKKKVFPKKLIKQKKGNQFKQINPNIPKPVVTVPEPVGEYLFNGGGEDTSDNDNHADVSDAVLTKDRHGNDDSAYIFYERRHKIKIPSTPENSFGEGSYTISFWVRTIDNHGSSESLLSNESGSVACWSFRYTSDGKIYFLIKNTEGESTFVLSQSIHDGRWHQITGMKNVENNTLALYVDGALVQSKTAISGSNDSGQSIWAGDHKNLLFNGRIDDIRFWNQYLSPKELELVHRKEQINYSPVTGLSVQPTAIPEPVAKYSLNGNTEDTSVNENHAIPTGAELTTDRFGNPNSAYLFYERLHRIKIPRITQNTFKDGSFSASFWIRVVDEPSNNKWLLSNESGSTPYWGFKIDSGKIIRFHLRNQEGQSSYVNSTLTRGKWHHITGVRNTGRKTISLYVDGNLIESKTAVSGSVDSLEHIYAGDHKNLLFIGRLDDIILWDKPLTAIHVTKLYNDAMVNTHPATEETTTEKQDPVGVYNFDGNADDSSSEGNHGDVLAATGSPDRFGNENSAYCFSARSHKIKIPLIPANTFSTGSFTTSFWVKLNENPGSSLSVLTNDDGSSAKWAFTFSQDGKFTFIVKNKEKEFSHISCPLAIGKWYKITGVRNAESNRMSLFVGSKLILSRQGVTGDINSGGFIWAGEHMNRLFKGCMDNITLWNRALSHEEIRGINSPNLQLDAPATINNTNAIPLNKIKIPKKIR